MVRSLCHSDAWCSGRKNRQRHDIEEAPAARGTTWGINQAHCRPGSIEFLPQTVRVSSRGAPTDSAQRDALELLDVLRAGSSTTAAMGIWTHKGIPPHKDWVSALPDGVVGELTDQAALDQWVADETGGLIDRFPLDTTAGAPR